MVNKSVFLACAGLITYKVYVCWVLNAPSDLVGDILLIFGCACMAAATGKD